VQKVISRLESALRCIVNYVEKKKARDLAEAQGMLDLVGAISSEALAEAAELKLKTSP